ncbi:hypothetical protein [Candidatus Laterigemmans baculatus]|uniref:hypothetical protein n=1 Tax=Candidatus Laterigemmans baculatus TaxID=2770505 RepID=UPI0013D9442A|nr:hypothetical protein [Candidatus Laterigemmans baculatus]
MMVPTATKTLGVNAAFLQEIKDSHPDLAHAVHALRATYHSDDVPAQTARRLVRLLDELRDCLAFQFALEESYGYIEGAQSSSETLAEMAEKARNQHCGLYLELSSLCEQAEELQYRGFACDNVRQLIQDTERFDARLIQHERLEAELIERAYFEPRRAY